MHGVCRRRMNYELASLYGVPDVLTLAKLHSGTEHLAEFLSYSLLDRIQLTVPLSSGVRILFVSDVIYKTYNNCLAIISTP